MLDEARSIYDEILQSDPDNYDAAHLSGMLAAQSGNHVLAVDLISRAIAIHPGNAAFHSDLGTSLQETGQVDAALGCYDRAINLRPDDADVHYNRGNALRLLGRLDEAVASYDTAIGIRPDDAQAWSNRGVALQELERFDDAVASYDKAIGINPGDAEAWFNRGVALQELAQPDAAIDSYDRAISASPDYAQAYLSRGNVLRKLERFELAIASYDGAISVSPGCAGAYLNRGNALKELDRLEAAVESYDMAISVSPDFVQAYSNRGNALCGLLKFEDALTSYDAAIRISPDYAEADCNRGNALKYLKRPQEALASYDAAIAIRPDYVQAYANCGLLLRDLHQFDASVASYDKAISIDPDYPDAYWNKCFTLLLTGDFAQGWKLYEWRWKLKGARKITDIFTQPLWLGVESLQGRTILLCREQGLGDTLQFIRYAKLVAARGARVIVELPEALMGLLEGCEGVSECLKAGDPMPAFDFHCPLVSLPLAFNTSLSTIPSPQAYLRSDPLKVQAWALKLGTRTRPRVGLAWSGNARHPNDRNRSVLLSSLVQYLPDEFEYISLQRELRDADRQALEPARPGIRHFGEQLEDFTDTAALCHLMDLVISVDTSVAHLSGALGKKTWVLLPYAPDWRWLVGRDDSPWYSSVTLYRQESDMTWAGVFERVSSDLLLLAGPPALHE